MADVTGIARFNRGFEKLFNVKGGPTVVDIDHQIKGVYTVVFGVEERYLFGVESFGSASAQAGVAGNKSAFMLRNPINSGVIIAVEKITVSAGVAGTCTLAVAGSNPADLATVVPNHARIDPRQRNVGSGVTSQDAPAADPSTGFLNIGEFFTPVTPQELIQTHNQELVLLPQIALRFIVATVNTALFWTIFWRERALESSELT